MIPARRLPVLAAAVCAVLAVGACGGGSPAPRDRPASGENAASQENAASHEHPASHEHNASGDRGTSPQTEAEGRELNFFTGMVPHHAQAVDMARICLQRSRDATLLRLCDDVVRDQSREIAEMQSWSLDWYGQEPSQVMSALHEEEAAHGSAGIVTDEDMRELDLSRGRDFDVAFVVRMIEHHRGAIVSARSLVSSAPHPQTRDLAQAIIRSQTREIAAMEQLRRAWAGS